MPVEKDATNGLDKVVIRNSQVRAVIEVTNQSSHLLLPVHVQPCMCILATQTA
jgi:hypothetical protein